MFQEDLRARGTSLGEVKTIATDRVRWQELLPIVPQRTEELSAK